VTLLRTRGGVKNSFINSNMASSIVPSSLPSAIQQTDVTQFVDQISSEAPENDPSRHILDIGGDVETRDHTIASVLARTVQIGDWTWNSSHSPGDILGTSVLPESYFASHPNALTKISGFAFLRAGTRAQVQVNCPNTAYGKIMLVAVPQIGVMPGSSDRTLSWWSSFPHVCINIGTGSSGVLDVPYMNYRLWSDIQAFFTGGFSSNEALTYFDCALLALVVIAPLDATTASVKVSVLSNLTDVEVKQSVPPLPIPVPGPLVFETMGVRPPRSCRKYVNQSAESSGFMHTLKTTTRTAKDVAGVAKGVGTTAAMLVGASIEPQLAAPHPTFQAGAARHMSNLSGPSQNTVLAATQDARALAPMNLFGRADEMDLVEYAQRSAIFDGFPWIKTATPGTILYAAEVNPVALHRALPDGAVGKPRRFVTTPLSYTAMQFRWYRGGIVFKFSGVKNPYFSGRVRVCFFPKDTSERASPLTDEEMASVDSTIVDIRTLCDLEYTVPYVNNAPWCEISPTDLGGSTAPIAFTNPRPLGYVYVVVQNELTVADVLATPQCWFDVEKAGAADIEFAGITGNGIPCYSAQAAAMLSRTVYLHTAPGPLSKDKEKEPEKTPRRQRALVNQSNEGYDSTSIVKSLASNVAPPKFPLDALCMSESIRSWRAFSHRYTRLNNGYLTLDNLEGPVCQIEAQPHTTFGIVRAIFAYYTGSVELLSIDSTKMSLVGVNPGSLSTITSDVYQPRAQAAFPFAGLMPTEMPMRFPWQEIYPFLPTGLGVAPSTSDVSMTPRSGVADGPNGANQILFVRAGDDMHFGFAVAPPPIAIAMDTTNVPDDRYQVVPFT
jgi:hypothetical protein